MAIPNEYTIQKLLDKREEIDVYKAHHPIHGIVTAYTISKTSSSKMADTMGRHLYQSGIQMRSISQLNLPFVARALEVSQNPNEPYIITEHTTYNLQHVINDHLILKPKEYIKYSGKY